MFADPQTDEVARAAEGVRRDRPTASSWPRPISSFAARATCSARGSTACRRCGSPTCCATPTFWKKPAATPKRWSPPTPASPADEHAKLRRMMLVRYGKALELGDVG